MHKQLAKITGTMLGVEDHGILTCMLYVDYGGSGQGVGGYAFDTPIRTIKTPDAEGRVGTAYGMEFVRRVLQACGVTSWEQLPGRTVYVLKQDASWNAAILGLANLPTEPGKPFLFAELSTLLVQEAA